MAATNRVAPEATQQTRLPDAAARGLPNFWYPILPSRALGATPLPVERFAENLVVWRDGEGRPHVFENHCPHRRAPLSLGKIRGNELACSYHGWRFDGAGACVAQPLEETSSASLARHRVKSYAAEDRGGYIWMFFGDAQHAPSLVLPPELEDPSWHCFRTEYVWRTSWLNILDNVMDPLHAIFLHSGAVTQRKRAKFKEFRITREDERGFCLGKLGYHPDGSVGPVEGEVEFVLPNLVRLDIADGSKEGLYRVVILPTPINETTACAFYIRTRRVGDAVSRWKWRLWWALHGRSVHEVAGQDREIMEGLGPLEEARPNEHLAISDAGIVRLRRRIQQAYRAATGDSA